MTNEDIIALGAADLAAAIIDGRVTARQAVDAYIERIEKVNPIINALVASRFDEARQAADEADAARERGEPLGPLHGVPCTVKEPYAVKGMATTLGLTSDPVIPQGDAVMVQQLQEAGAIILGKTNIPQLALYLECDNPRYGRTNNPHNLDRSPMGSTGGEAALVAAGGSALGLGSDLAGSVRVPPVSCGVHSLKATDRRLSGAGHQEALSGYDSLLVTYGPLGRYVRDIKLAYGVLADERRVELDSSLPPVPYQSPDDVHIAGLRIGVFAENGVISPSPALRRIVNEAADVLKDKGAAVIPFTPPDMEEALRIYQSTVTAGNYDTVRKLLKGSRVDWRMQSQIMTLSIPGPLKKVLVWVLRFAGQKHFAFNVDIVGRRSASKLFNLHERRDVYRQRFNEAMDALELDALLCPPYALPAFKHGDAYNAVTRMGHHSLNVTIAASYPVLFNVTGMPAGVVALSKVRAGEEIDRKPGLDLIERVARDIEHDSVGLPVGVQIAARMWREDVVLAVMETLEDHFRERDDYPEMPAL